MTSSSFGCADFRRAQAVSRRSLLTLGALTGVRLTLPNLFAARQAAAAVGGSFARAKSVIMLYLHGGHPQHETWDPKPGAPAEVRGEFGDIATAVPGTRFSELLPRSAAIADRLTIIRSLTHENPNHVQASLPAMTGHYHPKNVQGKGDFPPSATDFPGFGAVLDHVRPAPKELPTWVRIGPLMRRNNGTALHGQSPGFLGDRHSAFAVDQSLLGETIKIGAVAPQAEVPIVRLRSRRDLLSQFNEARKSLDDTATTLAVGGFYERAFNLLSSDRVASAFHLSSESTTIRERYGSTEFGQRCLLARRLAEAGVPMINVHFCETPRDSFDTHNDNFRQMKNKLAPTFDQAFAGLVVDLAERGMLEDTLVIATAEFGRTPKINAKAGRDHWPSVYSIALAGAGLSPGVVYGASDSLAAYPAANPHGPEDFAATLYHLLGVPRDTELHDMLGRPHQLVTGRPIDGILAS